MLTYRRTNRPPDITVAAFLMILFGLAEVRHSVCTYLLRDLHHTRRGHDVCIRDYRDILWWSSA